MKKILTLTLVEHDDRILLGMKKRGFGAGHYNGFGGKVEPDETIEEGAIRELFEESAVTALDLQKVGILNFTFAEEPLLTLEMHIFKTGSYFGVPVESEEMLPQWFKRDEIPYTLMWTSDTKWFPLYLTGQKFTGSFHFDKPASPTHTAVILEEHLQPVESF